MLNIVNKKLPLLTKGMGEKQTYVKMICIHPYCLSSSNRPYKYIK